VVLLTGSFMAAFDFFVVNVAAPSVRLDLRAGEAEIELVVGGYAFAYASALVLGGRLGDLFGHRRLFTTGMLAFAITSALCGVAQTPEELIAARLLQGLSAALMLPQLLAVISAESEGSGRARAIHMGDPHGSTDSSLQPSGERLEVLDVVVFDVDVVGSTVARDPHGGPADSQIAQNGGAWFETDSLHSQTVEVASTKLDAFQVDGEYWTTESLPSEREARPARA
jgi:hypothetical protein